AIVWRRMRRQHGYKPVLEDWVFHLMGPMLVYVLLFVGAAGMAHDQTWALFLVGTMALLQLCIGIHNAWDTLTDIGAQGRAEGRGSPSERPTSRITRVASCHVSVSRAAFQN